MILVDTSVWIDHFRGGPGSGRLQDLLEAAEVVLHPCILGEIALGELGRQRRRVLHDLGLLPAAAAVPDGEVLQMVLEQRLAGTGIGWVDAHLLASALASHGMIWTLDRALGRVASRFRIAV